MHLEAARSFIVGKLEKNLSPTLYYHSVAHTIGVAEAAAFLAGAEGITDGEQLTLLQTAALFHDVGFITCYKGHEEEGCRIVRLTLPTFYYSAPQIEQVCQLIMTTLMPQVPQTLAGKILCDADLYYLGQENVHQTAMALYHELRERELVAGEESFNLMQVQFLQDHQYQTATAKALQDPGKLAYLKKIQRLVAG
jgi:HD superfamily phosphodiesterase